MEIRWYVDDGYVGKNRPQYSNIDINDFEGMTEDEIVTQLEEIIDEDYCARISFYVPDIEDFARNIKDQIEEN